MRASQLLALPMGGIFTEPLEIKAASVQDYTSNVASGIEALNTRWYNVTTGIWDTAWWNSGNVLTMLADFTILQVDKANELNLGGYMWNTYVKAQTAQVQTTKIMSISGMVASKDCLDPSCRVTTDKPIDTRGFPEFINDFYDDEGWWALALIRSFDATGTQEYLNAAIRIFDDMQTGLGGPCGGGIYWSKERKYVNAITNELYLSVAASLANRMPMDPRYLEIAKKQWLWFRDSGMINKNNLINDGLDSNCNNNGMPTWSYNQGVILGGLTELYKATGNENYLNKAHGIAKASIKHLSNKDGVLVETDRCELRSGNCGRDGQQFKGIFIRNLRYLYEVAPEDEYRDFIVTNANVIWSKNRNANNMLGVAWNGPYVKSTGASQSAGLDVIVAAVAVA